MLSIPPFLPLVIFPTMIQWLGFFRTKPYYVIPSDPNYIHARLFLVCGIHKHILPLVGVIAPAAFSFSQS